MKNEIVGQVLAGKYLIERRWRENNVSQTYFAVQTAIEKPVTIKILKSALAEYKETGAALQNEGRVLSRIANPNILNVLDVGKDERGTPFIVLEDAPGQTLRETLRESSGALPLTAAAAITRQIAEALRFAHSNKIVHGALSADKILVTERNGEYQIKVLDFGAAEAANLDDEQTIIRADLPFYQAPEQLNKQNEIDGRADIYALGVLLFEILTGKPPFVGENAAAVAGKHLHEIPPSLIAARPDLPPTVEQVVQRALAKNPNQRFQSVAEFTDALANAAGNNFASNAAFAAHGGSFGSELDKSNQTAEANNNGYKTAFIVLLGIVGLSVVGILVTGGFRNTPTAQMNTDPNALPVQPLNPASSNGEDLSGLGVQPPGNTAFDPTLMPPTGVPGSVSGGGIPNVPQGIPPGLYPSGGTVMTVPGNSNSVFMQDLNSSPYPANVNANTRLVNANTAVNTNARPTINANIAPSPSPRPVNSNTAAPIGTPTPAPAPTPAPPSRPRTTTPKTTDTPTKPATVPAVKATPSGLK